MKLSEAREFISGCDIDNDDSKYWADLGCGEGLFTHALAAMLPNGSRILAVDKSDNFKPEPYHDGVSIHFRKANFLEDLAGENFDGIIMANSLHYVKDKVRFVSRFPVAEWLIIEYKTQWSNPWVPYPIGFEQLEKLFDKYSDVKKISERNSLYQSGKMYCAFIKK